MCDRRYLKLADFCSAVVCLVNLVLPHRARIGHVGKLLHVVKAEEVLHVAQLISVHHAPYVAKPKPKTTKAQPKEIWPNANITVSYVWRASQSLTQPKLLQYVHDSSQMMPLQTCSGGQRMPTLPNLPSAVRSPNSDKTLSCSNQDPDCPWISALLNKAKSQFMHQRSSLPSAALAAWLGQN